MFEVFLRLSVFLIFGLIWAWLQTATTSRAPIRHEAFNELKPGLACHISTALIWAGTVLLFYVFHVAADLQETQVDEWIFVVIFGMLFLITFQIYLTKILYDEYFLCFKSPFGTRVYDWDRLTKVSELSYNTGNILVLKFSKRFWVSISAMYEGYDSLERLAYQKSYQYPRP